MSNWNVIRAVHFELNFLKPQHQSIAAHFYGLIIAKVNTRLFLLADTSSFTKKLEVCTVATNDLHLLFSFILLYISNNNAEQCRLLLSYVLTYGADLNGRERLYITISGFPKATVQASGFLLFVIFFHHLRRWR